MIQTMERIQPILQNTKYQDCMTQLEALEQGRIYCRHDLPHLLDVARIAALLAMDSGAEIPRDVIYAAALLHDIGRTAQYEHGEPHAQAGERLAREILAETAFTAHEQQEILYAVGSHQTGGEAHMLARLICEADHACRLCFSCKAANTCFWAEERKNKTILL